MRAMSSTPPSPSALSPLVALAVALSACRPAPAPPRPAPLLTPRAPVAAAVDVPAPSPPEDPARAAVLATWRARMPGWPSPPRLHGSPVAWPGGPAGSERVVVAVSAVGNIPAADAVFLVATAVPSRDGAGEVAAMEFVGPSGPSALLAGLSVRDLNHDGVPDVAVLLSPDPSPGAGVHPLLRAFTATAEAPFGFVGLPTAQSRLFGVRDDAAVAAALPSMDRFEPPTADTDPIRFVARLELATATELRSVLAEPGLRLCHDLQRAGRHQRRCEQIPLARVNDAVVARMHRDLGGFAAIERTDGFSDGVLTPECTREDALIRCHASAGGPRGIDWLLSGDGATLRLVEATDWSAEP